MEMVKCANVFEYINPKTEEIKDYIGILNEFYGKKSSKKRKTRSNKSKNQHITNG